MTFAIAAAVAVVMSGLPLCPIKNLSGIPCPGCGLSRASLALLRGDLAEAWQFHPLVFFFLPLVGWLALGVVWPRFRQALFRVPSGVWLVAVAVSLALWLGRLSGVAGTHPDGIDLRRSLAGRLITGVQTLHENP